VNVVVDTNVIVSALINPSGVPASILSLVMEDKISVCYDARILYEYMEVLSRPRFGFTKTEISTLVDLVKENGTVVAPKKLSITMKDPDNAAFAEVAYGGQARYLITGNKVHFPRVIFKTKVVSPAEFIKEFYTR